MNLCEYCGCELDAMRVCPHCEFNERIEKEMIEDDDYLYDDDDE